MPRGKKKNKKIVKGAILATLGSAAIGAGALALSNKKVRRNVKKTVKKLENDGMDKLDEVIKKLRQSKKESLKKLKK